MYMTDDEIREMIAAEERADSVYTCDYSREVARRMRLNPGDPAWLPKYDEVATRWNARRAVGADATTTTTRGAG